MLPSHTELRIRRLVVVVAGIALLTSACGDSSGNEAGSPSSTSTVAVESTARDEPGTTAPVALTATDTGVTESVIRVGAVIPDTTMLGRDPGDLEAKFRTIADAINASGGIAGRMIELHFRAVNPIDDSAIDAACVELVEDIEIFAAIGLFPRGTADCYGQLNDTIVISTFAITEDQMAGYTAPGITIAAHPSRLVGARIDALIAGGALTPGMKVAVAGTDAARSDHEMYLDALDAAGIEVVVDTVGLNDGQDQLALTAEMQRFTEIWVSSGAEAVVASNAIASQGLLIAYNSSSVDLPMLLPEGTGVPPALLQNQMGLDLSPFELAVALVGGADQATKYDTDTDGVRGCVDRFESASGEAVALDESRNNLAPTIVACQVFDIFVQIADAAGPDLTTESFRAAAEAFGPIDVTDLGSASLGPDKFDLDDEVGIVGTFNAERVQFEPAN
jgi:hypothetical protein